jgi:hypothetical protein
MMKRTLVCLGLLLVTGASRLQAQRCRRYEGGRVVVCERERDRDRDRDHGRGWDRHDRSIWRDRGPVEFGVRGGYDFEDDQGSVGTQVRLPVIRQFAISPSFDAFFGDQGASWQGNLDGLIRPVRLGGLYAGGGLAILRRDNDGTGEETNVGWNLVAGLEGGRVSRSALRPFVEARWTGMDDFNGFRLVSGVNVPVGGGFGRW